MENEIHVPNHQPDNDIMRISVLASVPEGIGRSTLGSQHTTTTGSAAFKLKKNTPHGLV